MTTPEYTYVKGQGWIPQTCDNLTVTGFDTNGITSTTGRLEARKPNVGEHYCYCQRGNRFYTKSDGSAALEKWATRPDFFFMKWNEEKTTWPENECVFVTYVPDVL